MVYVLNNNGQPLMPTERYGKVRRLLKSGQAKVIDCCPFTIQLLYESTDVTQPVNLGIDAGSKTIGVSATTKDKVLYEAEVSLRNDITDLLSTRRQNRRTGVTAKPSTDNPDLITGYILKTKAGLLQACNKRWILILRQSKTFTGYFL